MSTRSLVKGVRDKGVVTTVRQREVEDKDGGSYQLFQLGAGASKHNLSTDFAYPIGCILGRAFPMSKK